MTPSAKRGQSPASHLALTPAPPPQDMRGSASPKGEARRERAAKPKRSAGRGREDYGWGWAGGVTKNSWLASAPQLAPP